MEERSKGVVVIGVGNVYRGDDGVGSLAARLVGERLPGQVHMLAPVGDPLAMLDSWREADQVFIVDAIQSGDKTPGQVLRFDIHEASVPAKAFRHSTHALSVVQVIELARSLGTLPPRVVVYGIEGANFAPGQSLSPAVKAGAREVADRIVGEIRTGEGAAMSRQR